MNSVSSPPHPSKLCKELQYLEISYLKKKFLKKIKKRYGLLFQFALDNRKYRKDMFCLHFWNLENTHYQRLKWKNGEGGERRILCALPEKVVLFCLFESFGSTNNWNISQPSSISFQKDLAPKLGFLSQLAYDGLRLNQLYLQLHKQEGDLCVPSHEVKIERRTAYSSYPLWNSLILRTTQSSLAFI